MLGKLFGKKSETAVLAPLAGKVIPLNQVNDSAFSEELLGKGVGIVPSDNQVVAPIDGTVSQIFNTSHAVTLTSKEGVEILIHIGLDTVNLKGQHFTPHIKSGDLVKAGDLLIEFDREAIATMGYDTVTPVVICNSDDFKDIKVCDAENIQEQDHLLTLIKK